MKTIITEAIDWANKNADVYNYSGEIRLHILYKKLTGVKGYANEFLVGGDSVKLEIDYDKLIGSKEVIKKSFLSTPPKLDFLKSGSSFIKFLKIKGTNNYISPSKMDKTADFGGQSGSVSSSDMAGIIKKDEVRAGFYEQWASIGLVTKYNPSNFSDDPRKIYEQMNSLYIANQSNIDASKIWEAENHAAYSPVVKKILQGTYNFIKNPKYASVVTGGSIIHSGVKGYYADMRKNPKYALPDKKENTADIIVLSKGLSKDKLFAEDYVLQSENGDGVIGVYQTVGENAVKKGSILQISLKIGHEDAQIGKGITTLSYVPVKNSDGTDMKKDGKVVMVYHRKMKEKLLATLPTTLQQRTANMARHSEVTDPAFEEVLSEGIFSRNILDRIKKVSLIASSKLKDLIGVAIDKLKSAFSILTGKITTQNANKYVNSYLKKFKRKHKRRLKEQYLIEASNAEVISAISTDSKLYAPLIAEVNSKRKKLMDNVEGIAKDINFLINADDLITSIDKSGDVKYLICNIMGFETVNNYINAISRKSDSILRAALDLSVGLVADTVMGESKLPVIKVFGVDGDKESHVVLSRSDFDEYVDVAVNENFPGGGLKVVRSIKSNSNNNNSGYYAVYLWVFGGLKDGKPIYFEFQIRTGGQSGGFQFAIEASRDASLDAFKTKMNKEE